MSPHRPEEAVRVFHERVERFARSTHATHTAHGLVYVTEGWVDFETAHVLRVEAGSLVLVPAGVPHRDLAGENVAYWLATFCSACLSMDESQLLMEPFRRVRHGVSPVAVVHPSRRSWIEQTFRALEEESRRDAPESPELKLSLLRLLLGEVRRAMSSDPPTFPADSLVADALGYIQRHGLEPISLKDVARAVHRTPAHVATTVKRSTGHTVGQWIISYRVAEAARWLAHSDASLDDIAARVGWRDKTHFIRMFKRAYGQTPAAWRKRARAT